MYPEVLHQGKFLDNCTHGGEDAQPWISLSQVIHHQSRMRRVSREALGAQQVQ